MSIVQAVRLPRAVGTGRHRPCSAAVAAFATLVFLNSAAGAAQIAFSDTDGKPVADAVLSLVPMTGAPALPAPRPAEMNQRDEQFVPAVLAVQTGADVAFQNQDPTQHHVYSYSPAKQFERKVTPKGGAQHVVFDKAGIVALGCNIHDLMLAYIVVVDTPIFGKSQADGKVDLGQVANGRYKATIWHARLKAPGNEQTAEVSVEGDQIRNLPTALTLRPERRTGADGERSTY